MQSGNRGNSNSSGNVWAVEKKKPKEKVKKTTEGKGKSAKPQPAPGPQAIDKLKEAQKKHLQAAQKHLQNYESSSEEELENDSLFGKCLLVVGAATQIFDSSRLYFAESVFKNYAGDKIGLQKTQEFLENVFQSGAATCLICIATVKRTDYVSFGFCSDLM